MSTTDQEQLELKSIEKIRKLRLERAERELFRSLKKFEEAQTQQQEAEESLKKTIEESRSLYSKLKNSYSHRSIKIDEFNGFIGGRERSQHMVISAKQNVENAEAEVENNKLKYEESFSLKKQAAKNHEKIIWVLKTLTPKICND